MLKFDKYCIYLYLIIRCVKPVFEVVKGTYFYTFMGILPYICKHISTHMSTGNPVFSIITVVYNGATLLEATIQSVINQTYSDIQYIIVDGGSTDGTLDIIKQYDEDLDRWITEPDKGIYDAMNKGLRMASGDFVWFMNCGDTIRTPETVEMLALNVEVDTDVLFGEVMLVNDVRDDMGTRSEMTTQQLPKQLDWKSLKKGMVVSHQAFLPKKSIAPKYIMDNLSADIDWVIECLKKSRKNTNTNEVLANFLMGGTSKQQHQKALKDRYKVLSKHYGAVRNFFNHVFILIRAVWSSLTGKVKY